jgi:hypothetical protein
MPATPDPEDVFIRAISFARAAEMLKDAFMCALRKAGEEDPRQHLRQHGGGGASAYDLAVPWVVNNAFSTELFLKCLHILTTGSAPTGRRGHELAQLFDGLPLSTRQRVEDHYREIEPDVTGRSVRSVLAANNQSFVHFRYIYERDDLVEFSGGMVFFAVLKAILDLRPDWEPHALPYKAPT